MGKKFDLGSVVSHSAVEVKFFKKKFPYCKWTSVWAHCESVANVCYFSAHPPSPHPLSTPLEIQTTGDIER
jgi:hypothetical protein